MTQSPLSRVGAAFVGAALMIGVASAQSYSGPGGLIPAVGDGGVGAVWPTSLPSDPFISTVNVAVPVTSVTSVELAGFAHTWLGDVHVVLEAPGGARYNVLHRAGFTTAGFGNSGDPTGTPHLFVESGGLTVPAVGNMVAGTYNRYAGTWTDPSINNTAFSSIAGPAGVWSLYIYDWAGGDSGSLAGWTLTVNGGGSTPPTTYCTAKTSSSGCVPAIGFTGTPTPAGSFTATCTQVEANALGVLFYGTAGPAAIPFQGAFLCVNPPVVRFPFQPSGGAAACSGTYSTALTALISSLTVGTQVNCQYWYRDLGDAFGTGLSNALQFVTQ